jgi:peptidoglycan/xylan/chitin deacetylase (PgdA/CDA1 family)
MFRRLLAIALTGVPMLCGAADKVALTFDDLPVNGPLPAGTTALMLVEQVVPIFAAADARAVYGFINAAQLEGNVKGAQALQLWVKAGHKVANHTYSHIDLTKNSVEDFTRDVIRNEPALLLLASGDEWRWLRYPYLHEGEVLEKRNAVRSFLQDRGYRIAQVTLDYEDYLWNTAYARCAEKNDAKAIEWLRTSYLEVASGYLDANRAMAKLVYGREIKHVMLLHLGAFSPQILPSLFELLKKKGFELTTLEDAQSDPAYTSDPQFAHTNTGTLLEQHLDKNGTKYPPAPRKPRKELEAVCR